MFMHIPPSNRFKCDATKRNYRVIGIVTRYYSILLVRHKNNSNCRYRFDKMFQIKLFLSCVELLLVKEFNWQALTYLNGLNFPSLK